MMKKQYVITGILSLGLVFVLAMTGCKSDDDDGGGGAISTNNIIGISVSDAPKITESGITDPTLGEAQMLFQNFLTASNGTMMNGFTYILKGISAGVLNAEITKQSNQKDFSASVNIDDSTSLKANYTTINKGTIKGSMKVSYKGSVNYTGYYSPILLGKDESASKSSSSNLTYTISDGTANITTVSGLTTTTYKVSGTIKTESNASENYTMKDTAAGNYSGSSNSVRKAALALSISNRLV